MYTSNTVRIHCEQMRIFSFTCECVMIFLAQNSEILERRGPVNLLLSIKNSSPKGHGGKWTEIKACERLRKISSSCRRRKNLKVVTEMDERRRWSFFPRIPRIRVLREVESFPFFLSGQKFPLALVLELCFLPPPPSRKHPPDDSGRKANGNCHKRRMDSLAPRPRTNNRVQKKASKHVYSSTT